MSKRRSFLYKLLFGKLWSRQRLIRWVAWHLRYRIAEGFFKGMIYHPVATCGNPGNKLIGTYEKELLPNLIVLHDNPPKCVFDVGAAEGYYAVGCAVRWKDCEVYASCS